MVRAFTICNCAALLLGTLRNDDMSTSFMKTPVRLRSACYKWCLTPAAPVAVLESAACSCWMLLVASSSWFCRHNHDHHAHSSLQSRSLKTGCCMQTVSTSTHLHVHAGVLGGGQRVTTCHPRYQLMTASWHIVSQANEGPPAAQHAPCARPLLQRVPHPQPCATGWPQQTTAKAPADADTQPSEHA
jgi:hypothetical protein